MGISQKMKNNMMRGLMMRVVQSNATLLIINHEYKDPSAMFASKVHNMAGGMGIQFASHVILQCEKLLIKATDTDFLTGKETGDEDVGFFKGNKIRFFVVKNRVCKPAYTATIYIDFNHGITPYEGLVEPAVKMGFLTEVRGGYSCQYYSGDKKITYKDLMSKDEIWNSFLDDFNKKSLELMEYSNSTTRELDKIDAEMAENADAE